jgi:hypothetical protein
VGTVGSGGMSMCAPEVIAVRLACCEIHGTMVEVLGALVATNKAGLTHP